MKEEILQILVNSSMGEKETKAVYNEINDLINNVATKYAEFCVACDREKLPLIKIDDFIKIELKQK